MTTAIPLDAARQALDDTEAALARLRPALAAAYGIAGENLTKAAGQLDVAERARAAAERRADEADAVTAETKRLMERRTTTLRARAETAERDARIYRDRLARAIAARVKEKASTNAAEQGDASAVHLANSAAAAWQQRAEAAEQDAERFKADHEAACRTIAEMHEAATGRTGMGPIRGVVEDVADGRARAEKAEAAMTEIAEAYDRHRRTLAAIFARPAETPFEEITEYAAKTLTRSGERLLDAEERLVVAERIAIRLEAAEKARAEAERRAIDLEQQLAAVRNELHDVKLRRDDARAGRDDAEKALAEAERVADRATQTLLRVKHARTAADAWTELGTHYHLPAAEAGRRARDWRSTAEQDATTRAEHAEAALSRVHRDAVRTLAAWRSARRRARAHLAEQQRVRGWLTHWADRARVAESDTERFHAAWHSARERAHRTAAELRLTRASRRRWKRRAKTAEQTLAGIRTPGPVGRDHPMYALIAAMVGPGISRAEARQHVADYFNAITGREQ
ncbi:hypothetical protein [Streptomyces sp. CNS654]|uniref:hypothetical protein n=1 Tax=Streptomyces sp. CNS654 TaxID=1506995 RepID=UPI000515E3E7|nr:hypothetical protein [Streptomyces sp. CNS654]